LFNENNINFDWSDNLYKYYKRKEISKILFYIIKVRVETNYRFFSPNYFYNEENIKRIMFKYMLQKKLIRYKNKQHNNKLNDISFCNTITGVDSFLSNYNKNYINYSKYNLILGPLYDEEKKEKGKDANKLQDEKNETIKNNDIGFIPKIIKNKDKSMNSIIKIINNIYKVPAISNKNFLFDSVNNSYKNKKAKSVKDIITPFIKNNRQRFKNQLITSTDKNKIILSKNKYNKLFNKDKNDNSVFKKNNFVSIHKFKERNKEDYMFYRFYKEWNSNKSNTIINNIYKEHLNNLNSQTKLLSIYYDSIYRFNNYNLINLKTESSQTNTNNRTKTTNHTDFSGKSIFRIKNNYQDCLRNSNSIKINLKHLIQKNENKSLFKSKYIKNSLKKNNTNINNKTIMNNINKILLKISLK
jgi:hypothetical protein